MSNIYNLEPPTKGKVTLKTSMGDIDIELWAKEAPKAVRNFVQLCLEGYYDGTIFHRLIKDFMIQGGDPTGTGEAVDTIYGGPFKDEFHSRLRFNHRGIVAAANSNEPNTNGSQFFITLGACDWLDKKNTIFGRVAGDTIYNLMHMNDMDVDDQDRPSDPPRILSVEVLWNPFEDIVPRTTPEERRAEAERAAEAAAKRKTGKRKASKNLALLSFGEEAEEDDAALTGLGQKARIRSAHEVVEDERLLRPEETPEEELERQRQNALLRVQAALRKPTAAATAAGGAADRPKPSTSAGSEDEDEAGAAGRSGGDFATDMRGRLQERRKALGHEAAEAAEGRARRGRDGSPSSSGRGSDGSESDGGRGRKEGESEVARAKRQRREHVQELQQQTRRRAVVRGEAEVADADLLKPWQLSRERYKQQKVRLGDRQKETMQKLAMFQAKLKGKPGSKDTQAAGKAQTEQEEKQRQEQGQQQEEGAYDGQVRKDIDHKAYMPAAWRVDTYLDGEDEADEDDLATLRQHKLVFNKAPAAGDAMARRDDIDDYVVFDPLLEKAKGRFSKVAQAEKKKSTAWAQKR